MLCSMSGHLGNPLQVSVTLGLQGEFPLIRNQGLEEDKADWSPRMNLGCTHHISPDF